MKAHVFECPLVCGVGDSREWACARLYMCPPLLGDTDDDDDAATSSPHVFPTSLAHRSHSCLLALPGHVT